MLTGPGAIHWSGGCECREYLDITLAPAPGGASVSVLRRNVYPPRPPVEVHVRADILTDFAAELRALLDATPVQGDLSTSDDEVAIDLPLVAGRLELAQQLADEGPPLDPIIAAIHRFADALEH